MRVMNIPAGNDPASWQRVQKALDDAIRTGEVAIILKGPSLLTRRRVNDFIHDARERGITRVDVVSSLGHAKPELEHHEVLRDVDGLVLGLQTTSNFLREDPRGKDVLDVARDNDVQVSITCWLDLRVLETLYEDVEVFVRAMQDPDELRMGLRNEDDGLEFDRLANGVGQVLGLFSGKVKVRLVQGCGLVACALPMNEIRPDLHVAREPAKGNKCQGCALRHRCDGVPPARRRTMLSQVRPFRSIPASVLGPSDRVDDLAPAVRVGEYTRLKEHGRWGMPFRALPQGVPMFIGRGDLDGMGIDLSGMKVMLARMPVAQPLPDFQPTALPPLSLIVLSTVLRESGARVLVRDLAVKVREEMAADLDALGDEGHWLEVLQGGNGEADHGIARLMSLLDAGDVDLLGLSAECPADLPLAAVMGREARKRWGCDVVVGGRVGGDVQRLLSLWPDGRFILDEGEVPLVALADALRGGRGLGNVPGVMWMQEGNVRSGPRVIHDLDVMGVMDMSGIPLEGYSLDYEIEGTGTIVPYIFDRGCPWVCGYCGDHTRRTVRLRSPELVVRDLASASEAGVERFFFIDHLLNADRRHLGELVTRLEQESLDIHWSDSCKALGMDPDLLRRLRKVGASVLCWGIDVGSARMARLMRKGLDLDRAADVIRASHEAGIRNHVNFIVGMPHETEKDVDGTCAYVERIRPWVSRFHVGAYHYYPGSLLGRHPGRYGLTPGPAGGVDVPGGPSWPEHEARIQGRVARVMQCAYGRQP